MTYRSRRNTGETVEIRFRTKEEFLALYLEDIAEGAFLWPTNETVSLNEWFIARIRFAGYSDAFELHCTVMWRRAKPPGRKDMPIGVGLAINSNSADELQNLLAFCRSNEVKASASREDERTEPRYETTLPAEFLHHRTLIQGKVTNISQTGCFIQTDTTLPEQDRLVFFLYLPKHAHPWSMEGEIRWVSSDGKRPGMGIHLLFDLRSHSNEMKMLVRALSQGNTDELENIEELAANEAFSSSRMGDSGMAS